MKKLILLVLLLLCVGCHSSGSLITWDMDLGRPDRRSRDR